MVKNYQKALLNEQKKLRLAQALKQNLKRRKVSSPKGSVNDKPQIMD
jgi:hypothetical protein